MFYEVYPIFAIEVEVIFNLKKYGRVYGVQAERCIHVVFKATLFLLDCLLQGYYKANIFLTCLGQIH